jgi:ATP-binding cassette subfamily B protein
MFWISPLLAVIALLLVPAAAVVTILVAKRSRKHFVAQWDATGTLNGQIEESFTGHELITAYGRTAEIERRFTETNDSLFHAAYRAQFVSGLVLPLVTFLSNIGYVVVAVVGGLRVASGSMSLGDVQAFIQYSRQFTQPLTQVASMANLMQSGVASAERVFEVLDASEQDLESATPTRLDDPHGRVEFEDVSFSYTPDKPLIEHLDLVVEPGQTVAIVGPTGAGKTTLVNLIMRFYELDGGRITLDGVDITELTRHNLRSEIGMVLQDTWLFGGTIGENIAYGNPAATPEEVRAAAKATYVDRFVHSLPDGYDTVLDAEGGNISAGEKQLITIARAFLSDPALLILDEATSSVDTRTELLVQQAMSALRHDRTSFVIAHRLSTIRDADVILVMKDGRIVEQGSHEDLLSRDGAYAELYNAQFSGAAVDVDTGEAPAAEMAPAGA